MLFQVNIALRCMTNCCIVSYLCCVFCCVVLCCTVLFCVARIVLCCIVSCCNELSCVVWRLFSFLIKASNSRRVVGERSVGINWIYLCGTKQQQHSTLMSHYRSTSFYNQSPSAVSKPWICHSSSLWSWQGRICHHSKPRSQRYFWHLKSNLRLTSPPCQEHQVWGPCTIREIELNSDGQ